MPVSITYVFVALLTYLGVENAETVANALIVVIAALGALYGRYRAGGITPLGIKKK